MTKKKPNMGQVRIISGQWRSRRLPIHDLEGLRPTTDRVKETLFNWISADLPGARVLDCFTGSGSLGFEALSRYASFAQMFELQASAAKQLKQNLATLKCEHAEVTKGDTLALLKTPPKMPFNIIFIDPPFRQGLAQQCVQLLETHLWLSQDALIYLETETELGPLNIPPTWTALKEKTAGQVTYRLYQSAS
ncbi:16S rRNA (guanine(966)-N(2))-methyltransferase RsmD [Shewanella surugensis]|uniref:Ribosomal RNA small subunit methyltransferase D n=1 Tax=Shewanella surugensis TaxID=212020 RepID=A0ABT0LBT1_9GAMM|nr:16S rRNA (guanine(966)-N(2))-methyltransferase RsmD [Shewanella surugensis]MCL1125164.1 16S rRNA (guanine(966)-N(2))-methyltransferase RsmD [Shewanella surugensis]